MSRGRPTGRVAYVTKEWNVPPALPGAEWQRNATFNAAEEILRDPDLKTVFKAALDKGAEVVQKDIERIANLEPKANSK
jgi:hypothetical protein